MRTIFQKMIIFLLILMSFFLSFSLEAENLPSLEFKEKNFTILAENTLSPLSFHLSLPQKPSSFFVIGLVTAYSSTPWETDEDPFITASGEMVRDGIVANNFFPFGTKIRIPQIFGDKIFEVKDRMRREAWQYHFDVWFEDYQKALEFGAKITQIEILQ